MILRVLFFAVVPAVVLVISSGHQTVAAASVAETGEIRGLDQSQITMGRVELERTLPGPDGSGRSDPTRIFLRKAIGYHLDITQVATTETYEVYFHIPVPFQEQVPILVTVESPYLVDYRFLRLNPPNVIVAARMLPGAPTYIDWTAWVLVIENTYADLPSNVPIPTQEELPDSVLQWLAPTDCAQRDAPIVQEIAAEIRGTTTNLIQLADDICAYCVAMPWTFDHSPLSFDAVYALNWGNSCTGHAHAGAALFRANGVPARSLLNLPTWASGYFDMHWAIDYFVPDYGWVRMETSIGQHPTYPQDEIVTLASNPEDEYPVFLPCGIEGQWHTSDPAMGMLNPNWAGTHRADAICAFAESSSKIWEAHALTQAVFAHYADCWGINLMSAQDAALQAAYVEQTAALESFQGMDLDGYIDHMQTALSWYETIGLPDTTTIHYDDYEGTLNAWSHGGTQDEWELGTPTYGPATAHSGTRCWGTDLDDTYENSADCWLLSPWIDLSDLSCAYLGLWIWNWVQDITQGYVHDPFWVEITLDGETYLPLSNHMGGGNDDPEIPDVGGWNYVVLALTKYAGNSVRIRFRFSSNLATTQPGSYVDDIHVWGRNVGQIAITEVPRISPQLLPGRPNPAQANTIIEYDLPQPGRVRLTVFDLHGRRVKTLVDALMGTGRHAVHWNGSDAEGIRLPAGSYLYRLQTERGSSTRRIVLLD